MGSIWGAIHMMVYKNLIVSCNYMYLSFWISKWVNKYIQP